MDEYRLLPAILPSCEPWQRKVEVGAFAMTLIDRLSKLEGPDWEISCEVLSSLISIDDPDAKDFYGSGQDYTASVDAAIALAERLFPGTEYEFTNLYNIVRVTIEMNGEYGGFHGEHVNSLPIAICIAILRAKEASKP
ncbi:hypothetical protein HED55_08215 [Ochrobactrum haematophilum]|uniref:Uncharacterized protein n=2 Tax=Brucella haematophila TaxID=419474 RepID=A0ABX1DK36_9HYPH|nr:hypothetical protein [Brucella haematophila]